VNVGLQQFPSDLADRATSLELELGRPIDKAALLVETLAAMSRWYRRLLLGRFSAILDAWRSRAPTSRGSLVTWRTTAGLCRGTTVGVDDGGALLVRVGERTERIVGGEVTWGDAPSH
jgi:BirA family biotin operon repressor/biotin-[acetyl-CoA-carboxylase] ligase